PYLSDTTEVFRCPGDESGYYTKEKSSYEWSVFLNGKNRREACQSHFGGTPRKESEVRVLWDYEAFHGPEGEKGSRSILFMDTVVKPM
ncbi:MAG: hypothetical protein JXR97_05555, partial [Planctomycetes bacterium]|nr:hypothetical protein [Planctomycetota bacterium]